MAVLKDITVLGLGAMGARMASRMVEAGFSVVVYNRSASPAVEALRAQGARVAQSPAAAVAGAQVVFSMVTDDAASRSIWLDPEVGALGALPAGAVAVEMSTLTPGWVAELSGLIDGAAGRFLDAPVAGSRPQAEAGRLVFFVGGEAETLAFVRPALDVMGGAVEHVGPVGHGAKIKLAVNALFGVQVAALAELVAGLERSGFEREVAHGVLGRLPIVSPALKGIGAAMVQRSYAPQFPIALVAKDLRYAVETAALLGVQTPVTAAAQGSYRAAVEAGFGGDNIAGIAQLFDAPS